MPDSPPPILAYAAPADDSASLRPLVRLIAACAILYAVPFILAGLLRIGSQNTWFRLPNRFLIRWVADLILFTGAILSGQAVPLNRRLFLTGAWLDGAYTSLIMSLREGVIYRLGSVLGLVMPLVIILFLHRPAFARAYGKKAKSTDPSPIVPAVVPAAGRSPFHASLRILCIIAAVFAGIRITAIVAAMIDPVYHYSKLQHVLTAVDLSITMVIAAGALLCLLAASPGRITLLLGAAFYILFHLSVLVMELVIETHPNRVLFYLLELISDMAFPLLLVLFCQLRPFRPAFQPT